MVTTLLAGALIRSISPVLVSIFNIHGGGVFTIFVMSAMFLTSALNRGIPPVLLTIFNISGVGLLPLFRALARNRAAVGSINSDLKIYDAAARRRGFITKDLFIQDNSHE